jgi:hypothetical protein
VAGSDYRLVRLSRQARGSRYVAELEGPDGREQVVMLQGDAERQAEIAQLLSGREGQEQDAARARFLSELFPRWPAEREELLAFAERVGHRWEWDPAGYTARDLWFNLFGLWPPRE